MMRWFSDLSSTGQVTVVVVALVALLVLCGVVQEVAYR